MNTDWIQELQTDDKVLIDCSRYSLKEYLIGFVEKITAAGNVKVKYRHFTSTGEHKNASAIFGKHDARERGGDQYHAYKIRPFDQKEWDDYKKENKKKRQIGKIRDVIQSLHKRTPEDVQVIYDMFESWGFWEVKS